MFGLHASLGKNLQLALVFTGVRSRGATRYGGCSRRCDK
jgi:hypothetical protein